MGSFAPIRDAMGAIVGMRERGADEPLFARTLAETMTAVGAEPSAEPEAENTPARYRPGRREVAALVGGLVLAVSAIAALNTFAPAPAPRSVPTTVPAPTSAPTALPTRTPAPTATPEPPTAVPTQPPTPTPEPVIIIQPPPCDPLVNPRFTVHLDVSPIGSVTGVSCNSLEEATANAEALRAAMLATAEGR